MINLARQARAMFEAEDLCDFTATHEQAVIDILTEYIDGGWQPIETAPLDRVVLLCDNSVASDPFFYTGVRTYGRKCLDITEAVTFMATHWREMPSGPTGE